MTEYLAVALAAYGAFVFLAFRFELADVELDDAGDRWMVLGLGLVYASFWFVTVPLSLLAGALWALTYGPVELAKKWKRVK